VFFDGILASKQAALAGFMANDIVLNSQLGPEEVLPSFSSYQGLLVALDAGEDPWSALVLFFEAFFRLIGIALQLKHSVRCGLLLADHPRAGLSVSEAGAICPTCIAKQERLFGYSLPLHPKGDQHALVRFYSEHWQYRFDRALLSYRVYREISSSSIPSPSEEG
jgi:recombinational DNA repair protein (RecF pathway)